MSLASLSFLYVYLPVCLAAYILVPQRSRTGLLLAASLLYYLLIARQALPLLLGSILVDYAALRLMDRVGDSPVRRRGILTVSLAKSVGGIGYALFLASSHKTVLATGVVIYCLAGIDCVVGAYRQKYPCERNLLKFALYCCFFPRLYTGPLVEYDAFSLQLEGLTPDPRQILSGLNKMLLGIVKIVFFGAYLSAMFQRLRGFSAGEVSVLSSWSMVLVLALSVYYNYSGYCDMARGVGAMFGIALPKNFYYPYQSRSMRDFFHRFNSTYYAFLMRTLAVRIETGRKWVDLLHTLAVGMLFGLWFGTGAQMMLWGACLSLIAMLERHFLAAFLDNIPVLFSRAYTFLVVMISFAIFAGDSAYHGIRLTANLFGLGGVPLFNNRILYFLSGNWLFILASAFFATNILSLAGDFLRKSAPRASTAASFLASVILLVISTSLLV